MVHRVAAGTMKRAATRWPASKVASTSRLGMRTIATSSTSRAAAPAATSTPRKVYPFAPNAVIQNTNTAVQRANANVSQKHSSRGVMASVEAQIRSELDPQSRLTSLFSRTSRDRIPPGSVLSIETYSNATKSSSSSFSGVLIAIRRRGLSTSFVVRNIVSKLGVEVRFNLYSPLLKDIKIVQRATAGKNDKKGGLRRTRRAKLYYLRSDDRKLAGISKSVAALRTREEAKKVALATGRRPTVKDRT